MAFADLIRSGNEQGLLLGDWPTWRRYIRPEHWLIVRDILRRRLPHYEVWA